MRKILLFIILSFCLIYPVFSSLHNHNHMATNADNTPEDWSSVQQVFNQNGIQQGNAIRINLLRTDLKVKVDGIEINPNLALEGWVAFKPMNGHTMMMSTLVLSEEEVEPVIKKLIANDIEIEGLHNHLSEEKPRTVFLHCTGHGDAVKLAKGVKSALDVTKTPLLPIKASEKSDIDWKNVESILGFEGKKQGAYILFSVPRADKIYEMNTEIPVLMGLDQGMNIQKIGNKAITFGAFVLTANEVNPVVKALTGDGLKVSSIHNHMLKESPRTFCLHYWGYDNPEKLAKGTKAALDKINIARTH